MCCRPEILEDLKRSIVECRFELAVERCVWDIVKFDFDKFATVVSIFDLYRMFCLFNRFCVFEKGPIRLTEKAAKVVFTKLSLSPPMLESLDLHQVQRLLAFHDDIIGK